MTGPEEAYEEHLWDIFARRTLAQRKRTVVTQDGGDESPTPAALRQAPQQLALTDDEERVA